MQFFGFFIMWMMGQMLMGAIIKSWNVHFVRPILYMFLIQAQKKKKALWHIIKHADANHVLILKNFEKEFNGLRRKILEKQPTKKKVSCVKQCNI
jgi:hypothetical protein